MKDRYILGLDLGQQNDYSVLSVLKSEFDKDCIYSLVFLKRYALKTSYIDIANDVQQLSNISQIKSGYNLVVDQTGLGRPVVDIFRSKNIFPVGVTITGGNATSWDGKFEVKVPKRELVSSLLVVFQNYRIKIAADLPEIDLLKKEFFHFRYKISSSGHDRYSAVSGIHDDIVMSISIGIWYGEYLLSRKKQIRIIGGN